MRKCALGKYGTRQFSSNKHTIDVVKTGIMSDIPLFDNISTQKGNKRVIDKLQKLGIHINEEKTIDSNKHDILQDTKKYFVGDFNQYPEGANQNMAKFARNMLITLQPVSEWKCNKETKRELGIDITSTIDYHPFPMTFPTKKTNTNKKNRKKDKTCNRWTINTEHSTYNTLEDSHGDNIPFLTRKLDENTKQELLIWRDTHPDIKTIPKIDILMDEFKPNKIILEYPAEGAYLSRYVSLQRKLTPHIMKLRQGIVSKNRSTSIGTKWYWKNRLWSLKVTDSFAIDRAIEIAIQDNIAIALSDYPSSTNYLLKAGGNAFDIYSSILWGILEFPMARCMKLLESNAVSVDFIHWMALKIMPHFLMVASYRNDMMALTVNECRDNRILYIGGGLHCNDIIDRLCGKVEITNPFKNITDRTVELKQLIPHFYSGDSKIELDERDIEIATQELGVEAVRLLLMNNKELNMELLVRIARRIRRDVMELAKYMEDDELQTKMQQIDVKE